MTEPKLRIVHYDDDPIMREAVGAALRVCGMEVLDTDDPARVRRAAEEKYDLFLIAMTEDERGGAALCRVLRQTGCQRPLVVVSSRRPSPAERRGLDESKAGLLVSPFGPGELVHRVRQAIAEESWSDEA